MGFLKALSLTLAWLLVSSLHLSHARPYDSEARYVYSLADQFPKVADVKADRICSAPGHERDDLVNFNSSLTSPRERFRLVRRDDLDNLPTYPLCRGLCSPPAGVAPSVDKLRKRVLGPFPARQAAADTYMVGKFTSGGITLSYTPQSSPNDDINYDFRLTSSRRHFF